MTEVNDIMVPFDVVNFYNSTDINEIQNIVNRQNKKDVERKTTEILISESRLIINESLFMFSNKT